MTAAAVEGANRAGLVGSGVVHALLLAAMVILARRANEPQPLVYAVDLVAAPAPGQAPRRAAEAALPTREEEEAPPVTPPKQTPPEAERPKPDPDVPVREDPALRTRSETTPLPGQTPSTGMLTPNRLITSTEIPASSGRPGPGEMTMRFGRIAATSSIVISSLRFTIGGAPSSPRYWARLYVNES